MASISVKVPEGLAGVYEEARHAYFDWAEDLQRILDGKPPLHPTPDYRTRVYYARRSRRAMRRRAMWGVGPIGVTSEGYFVFPAASTTENRG